MVMGMVMVMDPAGIGKSRVKVSNRTADVDGHSFSMLGLDQNGNFILELFTSLPPLKDPLETKTSHVQNETV